MDNNTNSPKGTELSDLENLVASQSLQVARLERERLGLRILQFRTKLLEHDEVTMMVRLDLAKSLLSLSMMRRDAGDHQGALDTARLYAEQEYLAKRTQENLNAI